MPTDAMVLDLEELRNLTLNDRQLMREILDALLEDAGRHAAGLEAASRELDFSAIARFARSGSRACSNVGANAAADAFRAVERHASRRESNGWRPLLTGVRAEIERLRAEATRL